MLLNRRPSRDESGAVAVMFALLSVVLIGVSAVAIDLGQVYAKRASLQSAVDLAVLAAAAHLDGGSTCSGAAIEAAEDEFTANWIDHENDPLVMNLTSPDKSDGYMDCDGWSVKLWAPSAATDYGLAQVVTDIEGVNIGAYAQAGVFSPVGANGVMPFFAVEGCDYGSQVLLDPPGGQTNLHTPILAESATTNGVTISVSNPTAVALNASSPLTVDSENSGGANSFRDVRWIAFSTESGDHFEYAVPRASGPQITKTNSRISLSQIPTDVVTRQAVWYIRVSTQVSNPTVWSSAVPSVSDPTGEAAALQVGDAVLSCAGVSNSGNFGTLTFPRANNSENQNQGVAYNMTRGAEFSLATLLGTTGHCTPGVAGAVGAPADGTNCIAASVGLAANPAGQGFITGIGGLPGILTQATTEGCDPNNGSSELSFNLQGQNYAVNNDTLTCFMESSSTPLSTITTGNYNGSAVLDKDIFASPRFFWVPVLKVQPSNGNSFRYSIIDFRPAFVTGELLTSTRTTSVMDDKTGGSGNGLIVQGGGLQTVGVVFFDEDALPESMAGGDVTDYLGVGTKVVRLTD